MYCAYRLFHVEDTGIKMIHRMSLSTLGYTLSNVVVEGVGHLLCILPIPSSTS
jgi:hypothetical protein